MRLFHRLLLGLFIALAASATASAEIYEVGKDRPGGDYNALSGTPGPVQCAAACAGDPACKAWTWVNPGIQGPDPVCYLKSPAPAVKSNFCCTSGVKLVGPLPPGAAPGRDRPGSDYSSFNLPNANPGACANACNGDLNCKAWTYVNPGIKGPQARCFLKDAIPAEVAADCCVSGAKLPPPPPPLPPGAQNNRDRFGSDY
ncbi:MAG: PAN domain-containing protein, partial [Rhizobiales bacterium]|nr:PAN domain-containing protein [Hyphomicrobiales bacterium]